MREEKGGATVGSSCPGDARRAPRSKGGRSRESRGKGGERTDRSSNGTAGP